MSVWCNIRLRSKGLCYMYMSSNINKGQRGRENNQQKTLLTAHIDKGLVDNGRSQ